MFKLTVPIANVENTTVNEKGLSERQMKIIDTIKKNRLVTAELIAAELGVSKKTVSREIQEIKKICTISYDKRQKQWILK